MGKPLNTESLLRRLVEYCDLGAGDSYPEDCAAFWERWGIDPEEDGERVLAEARESWLASDEIRGVAQTLIGLANSGDCPQGLRKPLWANADRLWACLGQQRWEGWPVGSPLPIPDGIPHREQPTPQTHEHWCPGIMVEDLASFIYEQEARGWRVAGLTTLYDGDYRIVVLVRKLTECVAAGNEEVTRADPLAPRTPCPNDCGGACNECDDDGMVPVSDEISGVAHTLMGLANSGDCPQGLREALWANADRLWACLCQQRWGVPRG